VRVARQCGSLTVCHAAAAAADDDDNDDGAELTSR